MAVRSKGIPSEPQLAPRLRPDYGCKMNAKTPIQEVLDLLDLEKIEENIFRGVSPKDRMQRVFGGQVLGQALAAADGWILVPPDSEGYAAGAQIDMKALP